MPAVCGGASSIEAIPPLGWAAAFPLCGFKPQEHKVRGQQAAFTQHVQSKGISSFLGIREYVSPLAWGLASSRGFVAVWQHGKHHRVRVMFTFTPFTGEHAQAYALMAAKCPGNGGVHA